MVTSYGDGQLDSWGASLFFKGLLWAASATKMGLRWKIGNDKKIKFWEDNWLRTSPLAIQCWIIYILVNGKSKTMANLWDEQILNAPLENMLMNLWLEVV